MSDLRQAVQCRNRAELLLTIAEETEAPDHRRALRKVAVYYERMAAAALEKEPQNAPTQH